MASEIRVDKITSLSGVGTITPSSSGIDISGITTIATLKATTGIVTTLTATTGIVTTLTSNTTTLNSTTTATGNINVSGANITLQDSGGSSDDRLVFGAGSDLSIYHDGSHSRISEAGTGKLILQTDGSEIQLNKGTTENMIKCFTDGAVELYHDNSKTAYTHGSGFNIKGGNTSDQTELLIYGNEGQDASILLASDDGDDNADFWRMYAQASDNAFTLKNYASGSYETSIKAVGNGNVELYYDGTKKFETHDRGTIFTEAGSGTTQAAIKVNTTLNDYGVITVRDRSNVNNQVSGFQVENASSGTNETNLLLRSVNLNSTAYSHGLYAAKSHKFAVSNNTTPTVQIDSDGLKFNNDQAAANALDDYEEGDFTPYLGGLTNYSSYNITGDGHYVKIGKVVHINIQFNNKDLNNSASGRVMIYNLPFAPFIAATDCRGVSTNYMSHSVTHDSNGFQHSWFIDDTYGSFQGLITKNGTSWANWGASNFTASGMYLDFQGTYFTAA